MSKYYTSPDVTTNVEQLRKGSSLERLIDELYLCLIDVKSAFCLMSGTKQAKKTDIKNLGRGVLRRRYEEYARYLMYRIPVFRPTPFFIVNIRDFAPSLKEELVKLEENSLDYVIREAIGRIFADLDERYFLLSVRRLLRWKLE